MDFTEFRITSSSPGHAPKRMPGTGGRARRKKKGTGERTLLIVGAAAAVLLLSLYFELSGLRDRREETAVPASAPTVQPEEDEELGRLRFVSGTVQSVYAAPAQLAFPVSAGDMELLNGDQLLKLTVDPGEAVRSAAAGVVSEVGEHKDYGSYVSVSHGGGLASVYYHLAEIQVESGQPLRAEDTIGAVGEDGVLYLAILQDETACQVMRYFSTVAGQS